MAIRMSVAPFGLFGMYRTDYTLRVASSNELVDDIGFHLERLGLSRTAGRVLGALLLAPGGDADAPGLTEQLGVAKSSLSQAIGMLERYGLVQRAPGAGRRDRYRLTDGVFESVFFSKQPELGAFAQLAERVLNEGNLSDDAEARLVRMRDFYRFLLAEYPRLLQRWEEVRPR
jgi:DNA-binding transcriptional regulator GbsR (MarR family)